MILIIWREYYYSQDGRRILTNQILSDNTTSSSCFRRNRSRSALWFTRFTGLLNDLLDAFLWELFHFNLFRRRYDDLIIAFQLLI